MAFYRQDEYGYLWVCVRVDTYRIDGMSSKTFCRQTPPDHPDQGEKFPSEQRLTIAIDIRDHRALQMRESRVAVMVNRLDAPLGRVF